MGAIRDFKSSFDIPFIIGGMSFIISALMHFFLMWIIHQEKIQLTKPTKSVNIQTNPTTSEV